MRYRKFRSRLEGCRGESGMHWLGGAIGRGTILARLSRERHHGESRLARSYASSTIPFLPHGSSFNPFSSCICLGLKYHLFPIPLLTSMNRYANVTAGQTCIIENRAYEIFTSGGGNAIQVFSRDK